MKLKKPEFRKTLSEPKPQKIKIDPRLIDLIAREDAFQLVEI